MPADNEIMLTVATPAGVFEGTFEKTTKIVDVVAAIVAAMNLTEGDAFELAFNGEVLAPERPLVSFGLEDGADLDLIASGAAV